MVNDLLEIILFSLEGAFLQVTVFVGVALLVFGLINYKLNGLLIHKIENSKKYQPIIGALLGLSPGCGGAILVMPLFLKGTVSYGTIVATLIATMGDAAFVMITQAPQLYILVSVLSFVVAIIVGYIVDYYNIGEKLFGKKVLKSSDELIHVHEKFKDVPTEFEALACKDGRCAPPNVHIGHEEGDEIDLALHHGKEQDYDSLSYRFRHGIGMIIFWVINTVGLVLGIMLLMQVDVNVDLPIKNLGYFGIFGSIFAIFYTLLAKKGISDDSHEEVESKMLSLKETLIHTAEETAFVGMWVFVAYLVYEFGVYFVGGEEVITSWLLATGIIAVIIGALVGLIPGCGPQIIFVTLFLNGAMPFAALFANAISQDGDALFPLLVLDRKSSLWATIITTIPAIVFGLIIYYIEISLF